MGSWGKTIGAERVALIRARYMDDEMPTQKAIALEFDVDPKTVEKATAGLPFRDPEKQSNAKKVRALFAEGTHPKEIASRLGVTMRFVVRVLRPAPETPEERDARREAARIRRKLERV